MNGKKDFFEGLPFAIKPVYSTPQPNSRIPLYEGDVKVHRDGAIITGKGSVKVVWSPSPEVFFDVELDEDVTINLFDDTLKMELVDKWPNELFGIRIRKSAMPLPGGSKPISGVIEKWAHHSDANVREIIFHVPNFKTYLGETIRNDQGCWHGRAMLVFGGWEITIDELSDTKFRKDLEATGGFGITHVGRLSTVREIIDWFSWD